jgi:hypothetical protein
MTFRLVQYRPILTAFMNRLPSIEGATAKQKEKLVKYQLSDAEWDVLDALNSVLGLFSDASRMLYGSKYSSLSISYDVLQSLLYYLQSPTTNDIEESIKYLLKESLHKYVYHPNGSRERNLLLVWF